MLCNSSFDDANWQDCLRQVETCLVFYDMNWQDCFKTSLDLSSFFPLEFTGLFKYKFRLVGYIIQWCEICLTLRQVWICLVRNP